MYKTVKGELAQYTYTWFVIYYCLFEQCIASMVVIKLDNSIISQILQRLANFIVDMVVIWIYLFKIFTISI